ncbi:TrbI/VirB10 family protein [Phenylobacterium sp.]|uniref:TrbI/VirB10 family protein n=1 Tax=Phenylobacterium sp. TaxID=1871053 RepID=UPI0035B06B74
MSDALPDPGQGPSADAFRLRVPAPRVTRLSRKVLAGLAAVTAAGVGGALVVALQHRPTDKVHANPVNIDGKAMAEALAGAPKDYSQIPRLGPPLPGDLGRPIVAANAAGAGVSPPSIGGTPGASAASKPPDPAVERVRQTREAARTSRLFAADSPGGLAEVGAASSTAPSSASSAEAAPTIAAAAPTGQAAKHAFLTGTGAPTPTVAPGRLTPPVSPYVLQAGSVIPAALITGLRSDLPGQITAQVTQNVYDSPSGRLLLIPQGARLIGEYDSSVAWGQNRALLVWTRLILPGGASIPLDREPGADPQGFAGLEDRVDQHWGRIVRATLVSTLLGVGAETGSSNNDSDLVTALRRGTQDTSNQTGQALVRRELDVQPTLTIRPGSPVRVIVTRDLVLAPLPQETR